MNRAAQSLGRLAKGVPKKFSAEEIARRTKRIKAAQKLRWSKTATNLASKIDSGELRPDNYKRNPPRPSAHSSASRS